MAKTKQKKLKLHNVIIEHVTANLRDYIIITLMLIVGIFLGVMFINNSKDNQKEEISTYINNYVTTAKEQGDINTVDSLKTSIRDNIVLAFGLWFAGTTLIGIPIVFGIILFRGFCLGYTISACIYTMGFSKGIAFVFTTIFLQNILFVPAIIALGVSCMKLYKSIMKDKRKENIKIEIIRHSIFSFIMLMVLVVSAVVKINVSGGILEGVIKYF